MLKERFLKQNILGSPEKHSAETEGSVRSIRMKMSEKRSKQTGTRQRTHSDERAEAEFEIRCEKITIGKLLERKMS